MITEPSPTTPNRVKNIATGAATAIHHRLDAASVSRGAARARPPVEGVSKTEVGAAPPVMLPR